MAEVLFGIFALIALLGSVGLLVVRHPIVGAVNLVAVMLSLAGIYGLLDASFLAVVQILVYAGAIMMLIIFVIMAVGGAQEHRLPRFSPVRLIIGVLVAGFFALLVGGMLAGIDADLITVNELAIGPKAVGQRLFDLSAQGPGYYILFELVALVLLAAMVAAISLAKHDLATPGTEDERGETA
jgi:NADH-quinone oxidoreductase subunit J